METQEKALTLPAKVVTDDGREFPVVRVTLPTHIYARTDHVNRCIEVNNGVFDALSPLMQEFVMCHEVCHAAWDDHDENRTNIRAAIMFVNRGKTPVDSGKRLEWLRDIGLNDPNYSNIATEALIMIITSAVLITVSVTTAIVGAVKGRNIGWYSWDRKYQTEWLNRTLDDSFKAAMNSESSSARTFFWNELAKVNAKDKNYDRWYSRSDNYWVRSVITKKEKEYQLKIDEIYQPPEDTKMQWVIAAVLAAVLLFVIIKN